MNEENNIKYYLNEIENNKYKITLPRIKVLKILLESKSELSIMEIEYKFFKTENYFSLSTIYKTLIIFEKCNIVTCVKKNKKSLYAIKK